MSEQRLIDANFFAECISEAANRLVSEYGSGSVTNTLIALSEGLTDGRFGITVDAVPIVRCKECKYRGDELRCPMCFDEWDEDDPGFLRIDNTVDDGFCHKGAKMDGGAEG
jgi:hypothetical protein